MLSVVTKWKQWDARFLKTFCVTFSLWNNFVSITIMFDAFPFCKTFPFHLTKLYIFPFQFQFLSKNITLPGTASWTLSIIQTSHLHMLVDKVTTLLTEKYPRLFWTNLQAICRTNAHSLFQILCKRHVWKMNYNTNKVQVSYMMIWERVHAHHSSCTAHTKVWLSVFFWAATIKFPGLHKFPDFSRLWAFFLTLAEFPDISRFLVKW